MSKKRERETETSVETIKRNKKILTPAEILASLHNDSQDSVISQESVDEIIHQVDQSLGSNNNSQQVVVESDSSNDIFEKSDDEQHDPLYIPPHKNITTIIHFERLENPLLTTSTTEEVIDCVSSSENESTVEVASAVKKNKKTGGGRTKDQIWNSFTAKDQQGKVTCKFCHISVTAKVERLGKHKVECIYKTNEETAIPSRSNNLARNPVSSQSSSSSKVNCQRMKKLNKQSDMRNHIDLMNQEEKSKLDRKLGRFVFGSNLPFRVVENPQFIEFTKSLRPSYSLPSQKEVGGKILDQVHNDIQEMMILELEGKNVTILQDGWSSVSNAPVVAHCLCTGSKTYFLNAIQTEENKKDAGYCFFLLEDSIEHAEEKYKCKVVGFGTDNCNTMESLRNITSTVLQDMFSFGCNTHIMNLLGQALSSKSLLDKVEAIGSFFKNHHYESSRLKALNGIAPVLSCPTRWNTQCDALRAFLKNHIKYLEISREVGSSLKIDKNKQILMDINNTDLFNQAEQQLMFLQPVADALDKLQAEKATLADAVSEWIALKNILEGNEQFEEFQRIWRKVYMNNISLAAYCFHPRYRGKDLINQDLNSVMSWLESKHPKLITAATRLSIKDGEFFPAYLLKDEQINGLPSIKWWEAIAQREILPKSVTDFILQLLIIPASTSSIERCFSTLGNILTKKRNRLGVEKAEKLCMVNRMLATNSSDNNDYEY